jgi:hypothetical protein
MRKLAMIAGLGLALSGCSVSQDKASAEAGVVHFHDMLDAGRYHDIYAGGEPEFRQTGSEQDAARFLQIIHDRLGPFRSSQQTGWRVNFATGGNIVNLTYNAQFASAPGREDFVFRIRDGAAHLVGYHVNSLALAGPAPTAKPAEAAPAPGQSVVRVPDGPEPPRPAGGK